jgi:RNase H-fold protein (predicted Holliday junction resolvase)
MTSAVFVGVDNGLDGGIAVVSEDRGLLLAIPMPTISDGKKRKADAHMVNAFLDSVNGSTVVVERPAGSKSVIAAVSMADTFARIETVLQLGGYRHQFVTAKAWQKEFWTVPPMPKGQKFDTKAAALLAANRLWPNANWLASPRCRVPHDGMIDAALIAEYARRKRL